MQPLAGKGRICVLCDRLLFKDEPIYNPRPISMEGFCCETCNDNKVQPLRLERAQEAQKRRRVKKAQTPNIVYTEYYIGEK